MRGSFVVSFLLQPCCSTEHDTAPKNDARGSHGHAQRHRHACPARREGMLSRQDLGQTPKRRRTRPCAVHKAGRMGTAGEAGGRRAQGAHNYMLGAQRDCLHTQRRGGRRSSRAVAVKEAQRLVQPSSRRGCRRSIVELRSILRAAARLGRQSKRRARGWQRAAGTMGRSHRGTSRTAPGRWRRSRASTAATHARATGGATKGGMPRGTRQAPEALHQRARDRGGAQVRKATC